VTVLAAPPVDHAPRIASSDIDDFPVPQGREEEWRFAPTDQLGAFMSPDPSAGSLTASPGPHVSVVDAVDAEPTSWLPTDRPSAIARAGVRMVVSVRVAADEVVASPIVVDLRGDAPFSYGHVDVRVGRHSQATVVLVHDASVDVSGSIVTEVGDGAELTMLSVMDGPAERTHLWQWHTQVGRDSRFVGAVITIGGRIVRIVPTVSYSGPGGSAELLGAFFAEGGQYLEHRIFVEHDQPHLHEQRGVQGRPHGSGLAHRLDR